MSRHHSYDIPPEVAQVASTLRANHFDAYLVGGCVRDMLRNQKPKDWDITTNARPEDIQRLFPNTFYENDYGTVGVVNDDTQDETLKVVEVTPYRTESAYSDKRRPDAVTFADSLEEDLKRRDFTINAIAYDEEKDIIIDPYQGQKDIKDKILRAVGNPDDRFSEDALRMLRAIRIAAEIGFTIELETQTAIQKNAEHLSHISAERIRDEFTRIVSSPLPMQGIVFAQRLGLLKYIVPELELGIGTEQNGDHIYDVWEHNLRAVQHAADREWPFHVRLAALLHDVAKPQTRQWSEEKKDWTFYGHDVVGGRVTREIMHRLKYPKQLTDIVSKLVRYHLFFSDIEKITLSAVRRIIIGIGQDHIWDLMNVRSCDRIGMGRPKETPYRLRKYHSMIEEALRAPVSVAMLKIDGKRIMDVTREKPGPRLGFILHALLEEAIEAADKNTAEYLEKRAMELSALDDESLKKLGEQGKEKKEQEEEKELADIRKKYGVS
jgi:poly(A) polymerase/tRNA nucleotidyltransferase (CCA-adding enzyme)